MSGALAPWLARWGLELEGRPPPPGGRTPYPGTGEVAFVRRADQSLVLKLLPQGADEYRSGEVLAHWDGLGAARLIEQAPGAVLIERARPGKDLSPMVQARRDAEATLILCEVMEKLNRPAPAPSGFRSVADWGLGFRRDREAAIAAGVEAALIDRAERLFFELCATQGPAILLHGDLQHYNVVSDAARGWLAIDPKGILGEAAYETGALLRNPTSNPALYADRAIIEHRVGLICERLGYPRERVLGWCFSQWVLSILWAIEDHIAFSPDWLVGPRAAESLLQAPQR
jgi:streptomycin 6-kinase